MKKMMMAMLAASAAFATPAMAATSATYSVTGNVNAICSISAGVTLDFGNLTDASGAFSNSASPEATDANAYCNQAATTIQIAHSDMTTAGAASSGFTNVVGFTPVVTASSATFTGDKAAGTLIGAFSSLKVKAQSAAPSGGLKLVAGSYSGSITLTLTPAS